MISLIHLPIGSSLVSAAGEHLTKGTLVSLIHPATMALLFASTLWTGFLGWQWRRTRTIPDELKALKKEQAPAGEDGKRPVSPVDARIAELEEVSCSQPMAILLVRGIHVRKCGACQLAMCQAPGRK